MSKEDKIDSKERLLAAGLKIFAEKGYNGSTFRDICDEAGSNIASINYYFSDKEGFYLAVREYAHAKHRQAIVKCWAALETDPWIALRLNIELLLEKTFDDTMFQANWLHMRELIDMDSIPKTPITQEMQESFNQYNANMRRLMSALLGDAATPQNMSLLRFTYHSLCGFLPIHKQIEDRCLKGQGQFSVTGIDRKTMSDFIFDAVKRTVESMQRKMAQKKQAF